MCKCIEEWESPGMRRQIQKHLEKGKIESLEVQGVCFKINRVMSSMDAVLAGEININIEGKKRAIKKTLEFKFCPFCGEKYPVATDKLTQSEGENVNV